MVAYAEASARQLTLPDFPEPLRDVWRAFNRLAARRQTAAGFNPIEFSEILALCRHLRFGDWELELIETIDDAVGKVVAEKAAQPAGRSEIPVSDVKALRAWAKGMAARVRGD